MTTPEPNPPGAQFHLPQQPERPRNKRRILKIALGATGALVLLGIGASIGGGADSEDSDRPPAASGPEAKDQASPGTAKRRQAADVPVKMTARVARDYQPGPLADGDGEKYIGIEVVIANEGEDEVHVNQMYFAAKDSEGFKHEAEAVGTGSDKEIGDKQLAPGEKAKGVVVFKGDYKPVKIEFNDGMIGTTYSAPVK
ncbi:DUF4352 domain-containing protein [Streptomyces solisilvae]|uniref:DUF4352 domain-containing protein n=1 Tax=Streptomyces malaysiensis TaxID=92644 RepID=UPI0036A47BD6